MKRLIPVLILLLATFSAPHIAPAQDDTEPAAEPTAAPTTPTPRVVAVLRLAGAVAEQRDPLAIFGAQSATLYEVVTGIDRAARDPAVAALLVRLESPSWGVAQAMEVHVALNQFRDSGKPLYASFDIAGPMDYFAVLPADVIAMPEIGLLDLHGLSFTLYYVRQLLENLGVKAQVLNTGQYKNALEPLVLDEMSDATREQMDALLHDIFDTMVDAFVRLKRVDEAEARAVLTGGPYTTRTALAAGAIQAAISIDDLTWRIDEELGLNDTAEFAWEYFDRPKVEVKPPSLMSILTGGLKARAAAATKPDSIAVIYALGPVIDGRIDKSNPFVTQQAIASEDFIELLRDATQRDHVKALVLRIDSPGGSAVASDRIWHELESIRQDMPVVVSMGNVAASGGYYIAMAADTVLAQPGTITGSIGVVGGKLILGGTYDMVGINRQSLSIGDHADLYSEARPWNDAEQAVLEELLADIYEAFASKAATSRDMEREDLDAVAQGRVWSGQRAMDLDLIDDLGGLAEAIALAREFAELPDSAPTEFFPAEKTLFELIDELLTGRVMITAPAPSLGTHMRSALSSVPGAPSAVAPMVEFLLQSMGRGPAVLAYAPWVIRIH